MGFCPLALQLLQIIIMQYLYYLEGPGMLRTFENGKAINSMASQILYLRALKHKGACKTGNHLHKRRMVRGMHFVVQEIH